ncbi:MAG: DUF2490 domain-containing protein [Lentimicrobium sp.]|nr:DUF2490 domain-containing protein [Lentimicrobium sp.]
MTHNFLLRSGISLIGILFLFSSGTYGQMNDAGLWTSLTFEAKLVKKLSASFSQEYRFDENVTELGSWISEAGLEYKLNKYLKASVNYRVTLKRMTNNLYSPRQRFFVDIKAEKKIKPLIFQFRTRFQEEYADVNRSPEFGFTGFYSRNKFTFKFDLDKKWEPYISFEFFTPVGHDQPYIFDDIRSTAGVEFALSKHHKLDLYYMIQRELYVNMPVTDFIGGIGYQFKF